MPPVRGSLYLVQTPGVRRQLQAIQAEVAQCDRLARRAIGSHAVAALRAEPRPTMNIDTGTMRKNYRFKVARGNNRIDLFNRAQSAKGFRYPLLIEKRYRPVENTLRRRRSTIAQRAQQRLDSGRTRGAFPGELR